MQGIGGAVDFFCQAEDGIRDAQESRGLGDVYKRQEFRNQVPGKMGVRKSRPVNFFSDSDKG